VYAGRSDAFGTGDILAVHTQNMHSLFTSACFVSSIHPKLVSQS
jgi:hypothetical protein